MNPTADTPSDTLPPETHPPIARLSSSSRRIPTVVILAFMSSAAVGIANASGISIGDDGVGYQAIADSLLDGRGLGYFLERPVTVWPPLWPTLMAVVAGLTPFGTVGAAILLNCVIAAMVVIIGNRLMRLVLADEPLILMGTIVLAVGPATVGLGHVLMTDMAFALVVLAWMISLIRAKEDESITGLFGPAVLAWIGFSLRYVGLTLIAIGGLWLLLQHHRPITVRIRNALVYGISASVVPLAWMARNHSIDGTFTGERHTSARGLIDNGFDIAATVGRFLVPGILNEQAKPWAAVGLALTISACATVWLLLRKRGSPIAEAWQQLAGPVGLIGLWVVLYLGYMLYVRTTTALNQLDLRLLFPAYFPTIVLALVIAAKLPLLGIDVRRVRLGVGAWATVNVLAGTVAMVAFGLGHPFFTGDYASSTFREVRANPALRAIPAGCETYSNLPNALYPAVEPRGWSPQRTALESIDPLDDLERIEARSAHRELCLVWIDEKPVYGHLWTMDQLRGRLTLERLAAKGSVAVYRIRPLPKR